MARRTGARGGKVGRRAKTERDSQDIRRLLRAAGSRKELLRWIEQEPLLEEFDNSILPVLASYEEQLWRHLRSPEARRRAKQKLTAALDRLWIRTSAGSRVITREEFVPAYINVLWPDRKDLGLGNSKEAVVRRLIRKLRERKSKAPS
ncbi:MAG: hypothetical protein C5B56_00565 [Proteobacteria bacterium]|nr:MAG: hypothetical protein C5B56_00565 [Pseudomonadota bacterium]